MPKPGKLFKYRITSVSSTTSNSHSNSNSANGVSAVSEGSQVVDEETTGKAVWAIRTVFLLFLVGMAVALGVLANYIVTRSENQLGEQQFEVITARALDLLEELTVRKRVVVTSMAQIAASAFPNAAMWPNVAIPAFETFAEDLIVTSDYMPISFCPMVRPADQVPGEQTAFEEFAYDYFYNTRNPPFPPDTALHRFGRGIWRTQFANETPPSHDTTGEALSFPSPYRVLFPELQNSDPTDRENLMHNIHNVKEKGMELDKIIACAAERKDMSDEDIDCGVSTGISTHDRTSLLVQPIHPAKERLEFTGVIVSRVSWDTIIARMFEDTGVALGLIVVLESEGQAYTYHVLEDGAFFSEYGDRHDRSFSGFRQTITLKRTTRNGASQTVTLYPSDQFFEVYATKNPMISTIGAVVVVIVTSFIFYVYDFVVRREFSAKQELLRAKRRFMRFVSHEVRTPLNAVCMGLALLQEDLAGALVRYDVPQEEEDEPKLSDESTSSETTVDDDDDSLRTHLKGWMTLIEEINVSAKSSADVLNDLLNYDKVEMGALSLAFSVFSIWNLVQETSHEFRLSAKKKAIAFEVDNRPLQEANRSSLDLVESSEDKSMVPPELQHYCIVGDTIRITQVLRNLVSNAIKFTPERGAVTIRSTFLKPKLTDRRQKDNFTLESGEKVSYDRGGSVQVEVIDSGAGMSPEQLQEVFRAGTQFNVSELQAGGGSGLGLYISKGIVEQHGGSLKVSSLGLGKGTTFTCTLPLHHVPGRIPETEDPAHAPSTHQPVLDKIVEDAFPLRVLVVDDVVTNRKLLARLVKNHGHVVDEAKDGREAVEMVAASLEGKRIPYDTILMDYEMPNLKGPEAAKEIRELGCDAFLVGVTGNVLLEDINYFTSCGANAVLAKPVDFNKLEELWIEHGVSGQPQEVEHWTEPPLERSETEAE